MPKSKKNRNGKGPQVSRVPFQAYISTSTTTNVLSLPLNPTNFGALGQLVTGFELYRFTELHYELLPRGAAANNLAVTYVPDAVVGTPSGLSTIMESPDGIVIFGAAVQTVPVRHSVPAARLRGQLEWYKANLDAGSSEFESQGTLIWYCVGATESVTTRVWGVCEFKNPIDAALAVSSLKSKLRSELLQELAAGVQTVKQGQLTSSPSAIQRAGVGML